MTQEQWEAVSKTHLDELLRSYERYFDIQRPYSIQNEPVDALAKFSSKSTRYVLSKRAKLWGAECYEYLFFFCERELTGAHIERIEKVLHHAEKELVMPHKEHMYSYLNAVILCEEMALEVKRQIKSFRWRKSYCLSMHGWMAAGIAAISIADGKYVCNRAGKDVKEHMQKLFTTLQ